MGIVVLFGCETDGVWINVRFHGALPYAVFYDPFGQAVPSAQGLDSYQYQ